MIRTRRVLSASAVALLLALPLAPGAASASPSSGSAQPGTVVVEPNDTLYGIAWTEGVSLSALLRANSMTVDTVIHPGDRLVIPDRSTSTPATTSSSPASSSSGGSSSSSGAGSYTVRPGDALILIARRHGVGLSSLLSANSLRMESFIFPGQVLRIPGGSGSGASSTTSSSTSSSSGSSSSTSSTSSAAAGTYVVRVNDALSSIAWRNGVSLSALLRANDLSITSIIHPGQTLRLPAATRAIPPSASSSGSGSAPTSSPAPAASSQPAAARNATPTASAAAPGRSISRVVAHATAQVGKPYRFFSAGPDAFDCSGLVVAAFRQVGVSLPHQSRAQARLGTSIDWRSETIAAGDLVFTASRQDPSFITHVGIAIDSQRWVHAVGTGRPVSIGSMPSDDRIVAVQRITVP